MFKHYSAEEVANELSCRSPYDTVAFGFIVEAVEKAKRDLEYTFIYESDIDVIDAHIRENACFLRILRKAKVIKMLTREELKAAHNNIITIMENRVMQMTGCNRQTANLVTNEILDLDRDANKLLNEKEAD